MSITSELHSIQEKGYQKSIIQRNNNSGGLDVFEAARYFSGSNETYGASSTLQQKMMRSSQRTSLEISKNSSVSSPPHHQKANEDQNNYKKPSSPSGKLARILSLFFNQISRKKISKTSFIQTIKDDHDNEIRRRNRGSSISHFQSANVICSSDSKLSSLGSEFKTPPCTSTLTTNNSNVNVDVKSSLSSSSYKKVYVHEKTEKSRLDKERLKVETFNKYLSETYNRTNGVSDDKKNHHSEIPIRFRNDDDSNSDSSSDLFELPNFDLVSCCSVDLPVYETTYLY